MDGIRSINSGFTTAGSISPVGISAESPVKPDPKDALIESLKDENAKMKAELESLKQQVRNSATPDTLPEGKEIVGKIEIDLANNMFRMSDVRTKDLKIDRLDVRVPGCGHLAAEIYDVDNFLGPDNHLPLNLVGQFKKAPMTVESARIRIPEETATYCMNNSPSTNLAAEGIKDAHFEFAGTNQLTIGGVLKKIIPVPFDIRGELALTGDNRVAFSVKKASVLGFLPVPNIITKIAMAFMDDATAGAGIERKGDTYYLTPQDFLPKNIKCKLTAVKIEDKHLVLEGSAPDPPAPSKKSAVPVTLPSFEG